MSEMGEATLIALDAKFTNLSRNAKLVSIGLTVLNNDHESFYAEFNDFSMLHTTDYVKNEIIPNLQFNDIDSEIQQSGDKRLYMKGQTQEIRLQLLDWLTKVSNKTEKNLKIIVDVGAYDWMLFVELIGTSTTTSYDVVLPDFIEYISVDISTMLYMSGFDDDIDRKKFLGITSSDTESSPKNALMMAKIDEGVYRALVNALYGQGLK